MSHILCFISESALLVCSGPAAAWKRSTVWLSSCRTARIDAALVPDVDGDIISLIRCKDMIVRDLEAVKFDIRVWFHV